MILAIAGTTTVSTFILGGMALHMFQTDPSLSKLHINIPSSTPGLPFHCRTQAYQVYQTALHRDLKMRA